MSENAGDTRMHVTEWLCYVFADGDDSDDDGVDVNTVGYYEYTKNIFREVFMENIYFWYEIILISVIN